MVTSDGDRSVHGVSLRDFLAMEHEAFTLVDERSAKRLAGASLLTRHMAETAGINERGRHLTVHAALMHNIGSMLAGGPLNGASLRDVRRAARIVATMIQDLPIFAEVADVVRHSETSFSMTGSPVAGHVPPGAPKVMLASQIAHLALDVADAVVASVPVLAQPDGLVRMAAERESEYAPEAICALGALSRDDEMWLDVAYCPETVVEEIAVNTEMSLEDTLQITNLLSMVIDFRRPFYRHALGRRFRIVARHRGACRHARGGVPEDGDRGQPPRPGKPKIPNEILEKPGKLDDIEIKAITRIMPTSRTGFLKGTGPRGHRALGGYPPREARRERLPLRPFRLADPGRRAHHGGGRHLQRHHRGLPYQKGMPPERVMAICDQDAGHGRLSATYVSILEDNYDEVNALRAHASRKVGTRYYELMGQE